MDLHLAKHLQQQEQVRVCVPLCGKTVALSFFARQPSVIEVMGIDGIQQALDKFNQEHPELNLHPTKLAGDGRFDRLAGEKITLLKGDFFDLDAHATGGQFDAVWDRGSMVAITPDLRDQYADVLGKLISPGGKILLSALERREGDEEVRKAGPPFSLSESDVRNIYSGKDWVESITVLEETDMFAKDPAEKDRFPGLTSFFELAILVQKKS
jgi:thiopurine S-methyltransferase